MTVPPRRAPIYVAGSLVLTLLAACGHNQDVSIQHSGADTSALGASASATPAEKDSGLAAGNRTLDSLHQAGVRPINAGTKVQASTRNEPGRDTSRLNNRATPGAGPAAPAGSAPGSTRP